MITIIKNSLNLINEISNALATVPNIHTPTGASYASCLEKNKQEQSSAGGEGTEWVFDVTVTCRDVRMQLRAKRQTANDFVCTIRLV